MLQDVGHVHLAHLLSLERGHRYNQRQKRTDLCALGPDGRPRPALYGPDQLHMTPAGYALWRARHAAGASIAMCTCS